MRPLKTCTFSRNPPPTRRRSKHKTVQLPKRDVPRYWDAAGTSRHCAHGRHTLSRRNIRRHAPRGSIFRATRMHACAHAGRCLRSFEPYVITRCPCLAPVRCKQNSHRLRAMQPPPAEAPRGMLSRCQAAEKVPAPPVATCFVASAFHVHSVPSMKEPRQRRRCDHLAAERVTASQRRAQKAPRPCAWASIRFCCWFGTAIERAHQHSAGRERACPERSSQLSDGGLAQHFRRATRGLETRATATEPHSDAPGHRDGRIDACGRRANAVAYRQPRPTGGKMAKADGFRSWPWLPQRVENIE